MLIFLVVVSFSPPLQAQGTTDVALAERFYLLGRELFVRSDFQEALKYFKRSHKLSGRVELLYNIARCHESLGEGQQAIDLYTEFLRSKPKNARLIQTRIENLRKNTPATAPADAPTPTPPPDPPVEALERPTPWVAWTLLGAGAALVATGAVMGGLAASKASDLGEASRQTPQQEFAGYQDLESSGQGLATGQIITMAAGGALAAAGAVWLILHFRSNPEEAALGLTPVLTSRGGMVSATLRY